LLDSIPSLSVKLMISLSMESSHKAFRTKLLPMTKYQSFLCIFID